MKLKSKAVGFILINLLGGLAVLGSYIHGFQAHPETVGQTWGGVPEGLRPVYTVNMFLAAIGYFFFTPYLFVRITSGQSRIAGKYGMGLMNLFYGGVMLFSALWMPMTFRMIENPNSLLWIGICAVLGLVGISSLGILVSVIKLKPRTDGFLFYASMVGCVFFCIQTVLLDAIIWTWLYPL